MLKNVTKVWINKVLGFLDAGRQVCSPQPPLLHKQQYLSKLSEAIIFAYI